jgi:hypothetical protein
MGFHCKFAIKWAVVEGIGLLYRTAYQPMNSMVVGSDFSIAGDVIGLKCHTKCSFLRAFVISPNVGVRKITLTMVWARKWFYVP